MVKKVNRFVWVAHKYGTAKHQVIDNPKVTLDYQSTRCGRTVVSGTWHRLITDRQKRSLPMCKDCARSAK